ncbi:MAG: septal ring lytic transglycosylase RlpA family protein [Nodosilinea sp.]
MKYPVIGGLTIAVTLAAFGAHSPAQAQNSKESSPVQAHQVIADHGVSVTDQPELLANLNHLPGSQLDSQSASIISPSSYLPASTPGRYAVVTVHSHALDDRQAATIYIKSIPVITLIGAELPTLSATRPDTNSTVTSGANSVPSLSDPVERASNLASQLQNLASTGNASDISVRWDNHQQAFLVSWGKEDLIKIDSHAILPDTTENKTEDALQVANRLRRLLGNVPALARVEGLPEPKVSSPSRVGAVSSTLIGMASWYGPGLHGQRSASGEVFNQQDLTAAHRTLPFGTRVRVTNLNTGQQVIVRINDRGPFSHGRLIDLSSAAASRIGIRSAGVGRVALEVLSQ